MFKVVKNGKDIVKLITDYEEVEVGEVYLIRHSAGHSPTIGMVVRISKFLIEDSTFWVWYKYFAGSEFYVSVELVSATAKHRRFYKADKRIARSFKRKLIEHELLGG